MQVQQIPSIGIIGFGRFGQLLVNHLTPDFSVAVNSQSSDGDIIRGTGAIPVSLEEVCARDVVIPAVPISAFEETISDIAPLIDDVLVVDVCSVKEYPVTIMQKYLPETTGIIATHPMFGPDSAWSTLAGQKIVVSQIRCDDSVFDCIKTYLWNKKLQVIETTPEEHDRQIARTQILTHFIGRGMSQFKAIPFEIDTEGYKRLLKILDVVENDTEQLFRDMNWYNRFDKEAREEFIRALQQIHKEVS